MDSFNKVISFALGLVVVLVFLAVVTGKLNLKGKTATTPASKTTSFFNFGGSTPTPTVIPTQTPTLITVNSGTSKNNVYSQTTNTSAAKSIPSTGLPTLFIPMLFSGLLGGNFLRKSGKK
jgi:hypothetical protein